MKLSGPQFQQTQDALLDAYTEFGLRQMLRVQMDVDLDRVAGGDNLTEVTFSLLGWAERNGQVAGLIEAAHAGNQENPLLAALAADARGWFADQRETPRSLGDVAPARPQAVHQVFLSYSRKDSQQMRIVHRALIDAGLSVWTDEGLAVGTHSWQNEIRHALESAQCVVVLMSPAANESRWVNIEVNYALEIGLDVFPVLLHGQRQHSVLFSLWDAQVEDGREDLAVACDRLVTALLKSDLPPQHQPAIAPQVVGTQLKPKSVVEIQRRALTRRLDLLGQQLEAAYEQLNRSLDAAQRVTIQQTIDHTIAEMTGVEAELAALDGDKRVDASAPPAEPKPTVSSVPVEKKKPREPAISMPIDFDWITIPAGVFLMGEDEDQHAVNLPQYSIARYSVTNEQYKQFVDATGQKTPKPWRGKIPAGKELHPVVDVSWHDAQAYCKWAGVQLPTEAQWEKAARGTDGRTYPWGEAQPTQELCNFGYNEDGTTPVGKYSPKGDSPYGLADVAGNVWEWTGSLFKPYPYDSNEDRENLGVDGARMARGGAWDEHGINVRCARRDYNRQSLCLHDIGFRCVSSGAVGR